MEISELNERYKDSRENQIKAIFATLFIAGNKLQTIFDREYPDITLKQFMLLIMVTQTKEELTFTQLGKLLGCSRQNIKKLAAVLEKKGFVELKQNKRDIRAATILPATKLKKYFDDASELHRQNLDRLFLYFSDEEIQQLFYLLAKLHSCIDRLENDNEKI